MGTKFSGSNAAPEIPLPKILSRKIARFFVSKISPATGVNLREILGFEILSSEKHFCRWEISEILLRVRDLDV